MSPTSWSLSATLVIVAALAVPPAGAQAARHRAILVSFDGFSEAPMRRFSDSLTAPALWSLFRTGACAESSRPAFPSVTPTGHAAIYTGAYSNVNGIAAIANGKLPLPQTTILESVDGYSAVGLSAEPIWITAARQGQRVFSHMATQSPGVPGYPDAWEPRPETARARASAAETLRKPESAVVNVYNELIAEARVLTATEWPGRPASAWRGLDRFSGGIATPRELAWAFGTGGDSLFAILGMQSGVPVAVISSVRDVGRGVVVHAMPTDTTSPRGRPLARYFSEPLRIDLAGARRSFVYARLFDLSPNLARFTLYISEARVIQANRPDVAGAYDAAVRGVPGNGSDNLMGRGGFGAVIANGGDGTAEWRYLETAELVARQFMRGMDFGWREYRPDFAVDYLPYPDEALHTWLGLADPATPNVRPAVRMRASSMLARAYVLVDLKLAQLRALAGETPETMLFVTGEHGMRPSWATFKPNVVLRAAGLLAADSSGRIDLAHTTAAMARGGWISVNRSTRREGIVPSDSVESVLRRAEQALRGARDSTGSPIVTAIWRAASPAGDSLGLGGPAGGDLYFGVAPGFYPNASAQGTAVSALSPRGQHGFPSVDKDMQPVFCVVGANVSAHRYGAVRAIDIAPTVSAWLGIGPPADAKGRSVLDEIRR